MNAQLTPFYDKFKVEELLVHRSAHWSWSVRPVHSTLGAGVLSLNRYCEHMSDLRPEEAEEPTKETADPSEPGGPAPPDNQVA